MTARILVVDDDVHARDFLKSMLAPLGEVVVATGPHAARDELSSGSPFDLVLTDLAMPEANEGLEVLDAVKQNQPDTPVIVLTAFGNAESALDSVQRGAWDYLTKPFDVDQLTHAARRALEQRRLVTENRQLRSKVARHDQPIGRGAAFLEVFKQAGRAAQSRVPVLITGETGTGKELVARAIHARSAWSSGPFIAVDCGAISESLMESELFGHARGAFTGAVAARRGVFEEAAGGTLFLDEIGHVGPKIQSQLLRALQQGEIRRVGESTPVHVDVRVVAATNRDLKELVKEGRFREDLLYRLDVVHLHLPPLRERKEDLPALIEHFASLHARGHARPVVTARAMERLSAYDWPGNVRQLENVVARALALNSTGVLDERSFPEPVGEAAVSEAHPMIGDAPTLDVLSRRYALHVMQRVGGNKSEAARVLGVNRKTLYRLLGAPGTSDGEPSPEDD